MHCQVALSFFKLYWLFKLSWQCMLKNFFFHCSQRFLTFKSVLNFTFVWNLFPFSNPRTADHSSKANQLLRNTRKNEFLPPLFEFSSFWFRKPQANKPFELMIIECMRAFIILRCSCCQNEGRKTCNLQTAMMLSAHFQLLLVMILRNWLEIMPKTNSEVHKLHIKKQLVFITNTGQTHIATYSLSCYIILCAVNINSFVVFLLSPLNISIIARKYDRRRGTR
jgi:hypothetical protein